jgi:hypothetical protein
MVQIFSRIKLRYIKHWPSLFFLYGREIWTLRKKKIKTIDIQMKLFRITAGSTLFDDKTYLETLEELKVEPVDEKRKRYKSNRLRHVTRMNSSRMTTIILNYRPNGRRQLEERSLKGILDGPETGLSRPN